MAFRQIKFISQELDKDYVFPSTSDLVSEGAVTAPDEIDEAFSLNLAVNIVPKVAVGEGVTALGKLDVLASINTTILRSTNFDTTLNLNANASILETIIASQEVSDTATLPSVSATINYSISKFDCPPAGQLQSTFCSGTTKYGVYTDGSCGTYNQVIETNSTDCGYVPTPTTAVPTISNVNPSQTSVSFNLTNNDSSTATIYYEIGDSSPDSASVSVGAGQTVSRSLSGLSACTAYTIYAEAQASGENRSSFDSESFTTDSTPNGTLLSTYCSGTTLYGVYSNGSCGTYDQVIEFNSTTCGYVPPDPPDLSNPQFQGAQASEDTIVADYYNPNNTNATLNVTVRQGGSLVDQGNVSIGAFGTNNVTFGQLNSSTTYTLDAYLSASGYDPSGTISNNVTTDEGAAPPPPPPSQTATPTVNLGTNFGQLTVAITNNDSSTASMSYSGTATSIFTNLPSTLSGGQTYLDSSNAFPGTYGLCATAQASGEDESNQDCDTQSI